MCYDHTIKIFKKNLTLTEFQKSERKIFISFLEVHPHLFLVHIEILPGSQSDNKQHLRTLSTCYTTIGSVLGVIVGRYRLGYDALLVRGPVRSGYNT